MFSKQDLIDAALQDIKICRFLATKVPAGMHGWRPTVGQRSVLELMQYLTRCGIAPPVALAGGSWDLAQPYRDASAKVTVETFDAAMAKQADQIREFITNTSDADLTGKMVELPWGDKVSVGRMFVDCGLKFLTAYRMQFFLYLKQMGVEGLGTSHCWAGREPLPKA